VTGSLLLQGAALLALPIVLTGVINRVKALWAGRRGPPILQLAYDLARLTRKRPVYSEVSTGLVQTAPYVLLGTLLVTSFVAPLLSSPAPLSFSFDFVFFAYAWALGRVFLMLGALDTGSAFEGMGASREAAFSALVEPALFLTAGTLASAVGATSLSELLRFRPDGPAGVVAWLGCLAALFVLLQVESARIPVDDPNTHLELTMIHEVMILDHSGPDLAAIQYASALKMAICAALIAALLNPADPAAAPAAYAALNAALMFGVAALVGTIESLSARLKMRSVPQYILAGMAAAFIAALSSAWLAGGRG
jgi:formate hydrogenlyase subunit 4